ncbi:MAG: hypothetical protein AAGG08_20185, partial [Actinomycetota bacterium]
MSRFTRIAIVASLVAGAVVVETLNDPTPEPTEAAGTPDITVTKEQPDEILIGLPVPVTLTISNSTGIDGYNTLIRDVLPAGDVADAGG